ncbi:hypothetical protein [Kineococcus sp. NUM-3379]
MPARRRHRSPRPGPPPARVVLDAADLVADPPTRALPHGGVPHEVWSAWRAHRPAGPLPREAAPGLGRPAPQLPFRWPDVLLTLYRYLVLPALGCPARIAAVGATVRLTHLDGAPLDLADPAARLRALHVLGGHRAVLDPREVLCLALQHAPLRPFLAAHPPGSGLDLRLVLAAAGAGLDAADVVAAHAAGTLTAERIAFLAALAGATGPDAPWRRPA